VVEDEFHETCLALEWDRAPGIIRETVVGNVQEEQVFWKGMKVRKIVVGKKEVRYPTVNRNVDNTQLVVTEVESA